MKNNNAPEIRFAGFSQDWEERKLGELSKVTYGGGTPNTKTPEFWTGNIPWIQSSDLTLDNVSNVQAKKFITNKAIYSSATKIVPKNSIAIVTRVGVGKIAHMIYDYATSQDFLSLSELTINAWFGVYGIYNLIIKEIDKIQGTSIKGITKSDLLDKRIIIPLCKEEQTQIGDFFKQFDDTIVLHQRELENLKQTKRGFLQKMFPQEGETVPEIRFPGFSGEWGTQKLGEIFNVYSGQTPLRSDSSNFEKPTTPWIKTTDLNNSLIANNEENISDIATKKLKILKIDTVLIAMYGGFNQIGRTGMLAFPATINQALSALEPVDEIIPYFLLTELNYRSNDWKQVAASSRKDPNITKNDVEKFVLIYPSYQEQTLIGNFFKQLDDTIALHERELETLKQTKKAFLQKMFL